MGQPQGACEPEDEARDVLAPVVKMLRAVKIPAAIGAALVLLTLLGVSGYGIYRVHGQALEWAKEIPHSLPSQGRP